MVADNGTYRTKDGRYVQMIGLFPHMVNPLLSHLQCANTPEAIQAAVEKHTAQQPGDEVTMPSARLSPAAQLSPVGTA
jgi:hypothetical protein